MNLSRKVILMLCTPVALLTSVGAVSFSLFLPAMEAEFGWSRAMSTVPYTVAMIGWGLGAVLFGKLADQYGTRRVILGGIMLMAAGFAGMGLSQNLWHLSLSFGLMVGTAMGACGAMMISLLVSKHFESKNRGLAVSIVQTASPLNPLLMAPFLYWLLISTDWRTTALVLGAMLAFVALPLAWVGAFDPPASLRQRQDAVSWGASLGYLRHRPLVVLFLGRLACGVAFFQIAHLVSFTISKGFSAQIGMTALTIFGASAAIWSLLMGRMADRYGRARMLALTYFVRGVGTAALAFAVPGELWFYLLVTVAIGPTFGTVGITSVMFYEVLGPRLAGAMLGLGFVVHQIGSAGGPMIGGIVYDMTGTYDSFMLIMGLILLAAGALTMTINDATARLPEPGMVPAPQRATV